MSMMKKLYDLITENNIIETKNHIYNNLIKFDFGYNTSLLFKSLENIEVVCNVIKSKVNNPNNILESYEDTKHVINLNKETSLLLQHYLK